MGKKSLWIGAALAAAAVSVVLPLAPVGAAPPTGTVTVTNTAANPVPVTGTVNVGGPVTVGGTVSVGGTVNIGGTSAPLAVVPSTPAAGHSYGIPVQSLLAGDNYTFTDARYAMKMSTATVWASQLVQISFTSASAGADPLLVVTDGRLAIPLPQPFQTSSSVKVTCMATSGSCYFQFSMVGS